MSLRLPSSLLLALCAGVVSLPAAAAGGPQWIYPVIKGYGGVHPRADVQERPDPKADYKVLVDVVSGYEKGETPKRPLGALERLARTVNLLGYAGVPAGHRHIVAVLDHRTLLAALTDAAFKKHFGVDNPNLPLLHALKQAGVKVMVCSQALAGMKLPDSDISPDVEISLSSLSDIVIYGHKGYSFMRL